MRKPFLKAMLVSGLLAVSVACHAQEQDRGKIDLEASELASEIIGAPVSDPAGTRIGEVADISFDANGEPDRLRVRISAPLGLGERTVEMTRDAFMLLRGHVVTELSPEDLRGLPEVDDDIDEKRAD